jgi:hypothetical protein
MWETVNTNKILVRKVQGKRPHETTPLYIYIYIYMPTFPIQKNKSRLMKSPCCLFVCVSPLIDARQQLDKHVPMASTHATIELFEGFQHTWLIMKK